MFDKRFEYSYQLLIQEHSRMTFMEVVNNIDNKYIVFTNKNINIENNSYWNDIQKSTLIESAILNLPILPIIIYEEYNKDNTNNYFTSYLILDGVKRINTIYDFYKKKFKLCNLTICTEFNNFTYSDLPKKIQKKLDKYYFRTTNLLINDELDNKEILELINIVIKNINL